MTSPYMKPSLNCSNITSKIISLHCFEKSHFAYISPSPLVPNIVLSSSPQMNLHPIFYPWWCLLPPTRIYKFYPILHSCETNNIINRRAGWRIDVPSWKLSGLFAVGMCFRGGVGSCRKREVTDYWFSRQWWYAWMSYGFSVEKFTLSKDTSSYFFFVEDSKRFWSIFITICRVILSLEQKKNTFYSN